eukprot:GHVS01077720.1.p1 GENE.GHVS01077720.1~~GHVS01077720.1.p1  ORF type:complete len:181 (+),score=32.02 GHVS01077720.1:204-746(+)
MRSCASTCAHVVASGLVVDVVAKAGQWAIIFDHSLCPFNLELLQHHIMCTQPTQQFVQSCLTRCRVVRCAHFLSLLASLEQLLPLGPSIACIPGGLAPFDPPSSSLLSALLWRRLRALARISGAAILLTSLCPHPLTSSPRTGYAYERSLTAQVAVLPPTAGGEGIKAVITKAMSVQHLC